MDPVHAPKIEENETKEIKSVGQKLIRILKICNENIRELVAKKQQPNFFILPTMYFSDILFHYLNAFKCNLHKCKRTTELIYHIIKTN